MKLIVTDANIFIDLEAGGLLDEMFRLQAFEFTVPDILYIEELADRHPHLPGLGLRIASLDGNAIADAEALRSTYKRTSQNDLFALALARAEGCPLLTGDQKLREAAAAEGVETHGTLWLVQQLHDELGLDANRLKAAYEAMRSDGSRLPWTEVERQLAAWAG